MQVQTAVVGGAPLRQDLHSIKMRTFTILGALTCLCAAAVAQSGQQAVADFEKFQSVLSENNKALRALQDIRSVQSAAASGTKRVAQHHITQPSRAPSNIVYGKGRHAEQPKFSRPQYAVRPKQNKPKFSQFAQEDATAGLGSDVASQYAHNYKISSQDTEALQKYMQKYANQMYAAQKHATQLSDSQKYVLGQDPFAKKLVNTAPQTQKYQAPKFIPLQAQDAKEAAVTYGYQDQTSHEAPEPITQTEKYPSFQVQQKLIVHNQKSNKAPPKKAYSYDNSPQYTHLYGNSLEPQLVNQYLTTYGSPDKEALTGYEGHQSYGQYGVGTGAADKSELSKITGYKIPGAFSLSLGHGQGAEEKGHEVVEHHHDEHHYPHHEPKYEYMYQVQDHEKHNHFGHSEARKGKTTWGRYYVQLPDGRFETVKYWADKSGYHAEVDYKGHAKHPSHKEHSIGHQGLSSLGGGSSYIGGSSIKGYSTKSEDIPTTGYSTSELGEDF